MVNLEQSLCSVFIALKQNKNCNQREKRAKFKYLLVARRHSLCYKVLHSYNFLIVEQA